MSTSIAISDGVYGFLTGSVYGAVWGMITPFVEELPGAFIQ
jgi:hypothetical protein